MPDFIRPKFIDCHVHFFLKHLADYENEFDASGLSGAWNIVRDPSVHEGTTWKEYHSLIEKSLAHRPDPVYTFYWPDYSKLTDADFTNKCVKRIRELKKRGIAGLKVWKDMGLGLKDPSGNLMMLDDERLNPIWESLVENKLILIAHVADPANFWLPFDKSNPSYESLKRRPEWHFGKPGLPSREELFERRNRLHHRFPQLTIVNCHFGGYAPDIVQLGKWMDEMPNFHASLGSHIAKENDAETGRFLAKHAARIMFETDLGIPRGRKSDSPWNINMYRETLQKVCDKIGRHGNDTLENFAFRNARRIIAEHIG